MERDTPRYRRLRRTFCALVTALSARKLVFLDESYCKTGMCREHAWSLRGRRALGTRPFRCWKTISLLGAIRLGRRPLLMTHKGPVNGATFLRFVRTRLVPWLRRGDVVVMDNLNMHKMVGVREAIAAAGALAVYLPPYSPELNPIELWWGDMKREFRSLALVLEDELRRAARRLRAGLPTRKRAGFEKRCGRLNSSDQRVSDP